MSAIKVTKLDGDLNVGRNIASGGTLFVQGNAHLKSNLRVDGWLDCVNFKTVNKGLFSSEALLKKIYPEPKEGWYAIVGNELPGLIYVVENGEWVSTGNMGGNPTLDHNDINLAIEESKNATEEAKAATAEAIEQAYHALIQGDYAKLQGDYAKEIVEAYINDACIVSYYDTAIDFPVVGVENRLYVDTTNSKLYLYHNGYINVGTSSDWHDIETIDGNF